MSEVITDKDREYEAREQASAPGADQAMGDRVNNRSLRPRSEAFKEFIFDVHPRTSRGVGTPVPG